MSVRIRQSKSISSLQVFRKIMRRGDVDALPQKSSAGCLKRIVANFLQKTDSMLEPNQERILCLDIRPRSFAFVAFEGPRVVLDWGARSFRRGVNAVRVPLRIK